MIRGFQDKIPKIDASAFIAENAVIIGDVEIGPGSSVWYNVVLRGDVNSIQIGTRTNIQDGTIIHVSREEVFSTTIEDEVTIGHSATIHGCHIKRGCLIGIGSIILDGALIGENSLVGAGSLVTPGTIVPPRSLVLGSPAKIVRELNNDEIENLEKFWRGYQTLKDIYIAEQ